MFASVRLCGAGGEQDGASVYDAAGGAAGALPRGSVVLAASSTWATLYIFLPFYFVSSVLLEASVVSIARNVTRPRVFSVRYLAQVVSRMERQCVAVRAGRQGAPARQRGAGGQQHGATLYLFFMFNLRVLEVKLNISL
jgi:hypothetical protein